jgi:nucleoid DNA-binding protein
MPISKNEFTQKLAIKMGATEKEAATWVEAYTETLFDVFKTGNGVTINGLGGFHVSAGYRGGRVFKFNPSQQIRKMMGWSSTYKGEV